MDKKIAQLVKKYPRLSLLQTAWFSGLSEIKKEFVLDVIEDAIFWTEQEKKPNADDGFRFLAASHGLSKAREEAEEKGLEGKEREQYIRPHQDLYTMYNPYSGNSNNSKE